MGSSRSPCTSSSSPRRCSAESSGIRRASDGADDAVALHQQQLGKERSVLAGDPRHQRDPAGRPCRGHPVWRLSASRSESTISRISSSKHVLRLPARARGSALAAIADQVVDLRRPDRTSRIRIRPRARSRSPSPASIERDLARTPAPSAPCRSRSRSRRRLVALKHQPHRLDVVLRVAPIALGVQIAEAQLLATSPSRIAAACQLILRSTNSSPRRGQFEHRRACQRRRRAPAALRLEVVDVHSSSGTAYRERSLRTSAGSLTKVLALRPDPHGRREVDAGSTSARRAALTYTEAGCSV